MGNAATLAQLRTRTLRAADMQAQTSTGQTGFLAIDEVNQYINDSLTELHDIQVLRFSDYVVRKWQFTLVANQEDYPLPDDFYKLRAVYWMVQTSPPQRRRLSSFMEEERDLYGDATTAGYSGALPRYRIADGVISFAPFSSGTATIELRYVYQAPRLNNDNDTVAFPLINGWDEYAVVDAAIKCRDKGELSTDRLNGRKAALYKRIEVAAADRDISAPQRVVDVYSARRWI